MSITSRIGSLFGSADDDIYDPDTQDQAYDSDPVAPGAATSERDDRDSAGMTPPPMSSRVSQGISSASAITMKVCQPEKFEDAMQVADHLLAHNTVVLNLEGANKENVIRIIDFMFGVTYAIGGKIRRVASSTYVIAPKNVEVTGEQNKGEEQPKPRELF